MNPENDPTCAFEEVARTQLEGLRDDLQDLRQRFQTLEGKLAVSIVLLCSNLAALIFGAVNGSVTTGIQP